MYALYPGFIGAYDNMRDGELIMTAMKFKLTALHLVKGFSPSVRMLLELYIPEFT